MTDKPSASERLNAVENFIEAEEESLRRVYASHAYYEAFANIRELIKQNAALTAEVAEIKKLLGEPDEGNRYRLLLNENAELKAGEAALADLNTTYGREIQSLRKERDELRREIQALKEDYTELKIEKNTLDRTNEDDMREIHTLMEENKKLRAEIDALSLENDGLRSSYKDAVQLTEAGFNSRDKLLTKVEYEHGAWRTQCEKLAEVNSKVMFALQCMIINYNGKVPGLTDQEVFDGAIIARDEAKQALAEFEKFKEGR